MVRNGKAFPTSGAKSAGLYAITFSYKVVGSHNSGTYQYPAITLLDSGTDAYNLYVNSSVGASALSSVASMVVSNPQSGAVLQSVRGAASGPDIISLATQSNTVRTILGIGFFMGNSVMYDLANSLTGVTSFFVTDADAETTNAAPFTVGASTGNAGQLGMAGMISGAGGVVVTQGGQAKLSAANTYTGTTNIDQGGWLGLVGPGSIAQSAGVVNNGVFDISGTGIVPGTAGLTRTALRSRPSPATVSYRSAGRRSRSRQPRAPIRASSPTVAMRVAPAAASSSPAAPKL